MRILVLLMFFFFIFQRTAFAAIIFQINNFEKVNDYYSVDAEITGAATGSAYFVQAMFTPVDSNNYFGFTWGKKGEWVKYVSSPDKEFIRSDFPILENNKGQKILMKPDTGSSKYHGTGQYLLKLKRYTGESSSGYYSDNSLTVTLSDSSPSPQETVTLSPTPTQSSTQTPTASPTPSPTPVPTTSKTVTGSPTKILSPTPRNTAVLSPESHSGSPSSTLNSLLGIEVPGNSDSASPSAIQTDEPSPTLKVGENQPNPIGTTTFFGVATTAIGLLSLAFWRLRRLTRLDRIK